MSQLFMALYIVERRAFSDTNFHASYFYFMFNCILFYDYCAVVNICTTTCTWLRLTAIDKEIWWRWWWWWWCRLDL